MKRHLSFFICIFFICGTLHASPRDIQTALNIASNYFSTNSSSNKKKTKANQHISHTWTALQTNGQPAFYVFNRGTDGGFVIISAEDRTRNILAYSDDGHFDESAIPDNMRIWLGIYQKEISQIAQELEFPNDNSAYTATYSKAYSPVAPLCSTKWGQGFPYNMYCPLKGEEQCVTGCVATAAAQLMKAHNYPNQGIGSHSYNWAKGEQETTTLSADFGNTTYQWSMMRNSYPSSATEEQKDAVATLMYHCGVACDMNYGLSVEGGSGAVSSRMLGAMVNYFGYDAAIQPIDKDNISEEAFVDSIYADLLVGNPVFISARTINNEGHAFVCDGIDANGFVHINWGWTGNNDAYYRVSAFNPQYQGVGGSTNNYAFTEHVVAYTHIQPNAGGTMKYVFTANTILPSNQQGNEQKHFARSEQVFLHMTKMENQSIFDLNISPVILLYKEGKLYNSIESDHDVLTIPSGYYYNEYTETADFSTLPNGRYQLKPAIRVHVQNSIDVPVLAAGIGECRFMMSITNDSIFIGNPEGVKQNECGYNLVWSLDTISGTLSIMGDGDMFNYDIKSTPWYDKATSISQINLPDNLTTIGDNAFADCINLTSIKIPDGVVYIGNQAFSGCTALSTITCEAIAPPTINGDATFNNVSKLIPIYVPAGSINFYKKANYWNEFINILSKEACTIASGFCGAEGDSTNLSWNISCDSVLTISGSGEMASWWLYDDVLNTPWVNYRTSIKEVIIQDRITNIGVNAFYGCANLISITIPNSVTGIGGGAFYGCTSLKSITIPDGVTNIGYCTFQKCSSLISVTLPDSLEAIEDNAFNECHNLESINIPRSVRRIGGAAFCECFKLASIQIPDGITSIEYYTFFLCYSLKSVTIPNSVTSIGNRAFMACSGLTSFSIPDSCRTIGEEAFDNCTSLKSITIPDGVTSIGSLAFGSCWGLSTINIPSSIINIGDQALRRCINLTSIDVSEENPMYCSVDGVLFNKDKTTLLRYPCGRGAYAIPISVTAIGDGAFGDCDNMNSIEIPSSVLVIGNEAFGNCSRLSVITIPENVTSIGQKALRSGSSLRKIICLNSNPPILGDDAYDYNRIPLYVPSASVALYRETYNFSYIFPIEENSGEPCILASGYCGAEGDSTNLTWQLSCYGVLDISGNGRMANYNTSKHSPWRYVNFPIETIVIGDGVENVGYDAFVGTTVDSIYLGANVSDIGQERFGGCHALTNIIVDKNNATYSSINGVLFDKEGLTLVQYPLGRREDEYIVPDGVTTIGYNAFYQCYNIESVILPNSVTRIGSWAFASSGIKSIILPDSLQRIESSAFRNASELNSLYIPSSVTYISIQVFNSCYQLASIVVDEKNPQYDSRENCNAIIKTSTNSLIVGCKNTIIPNTVTTIDLDAFNGCNITSVTIPSSVTTIGDGAFGYCDSLTTVICKAVTPPTMRYSNVFNRVDKSKITLYVPEESIELYQVADEWREFTIILPVPNGMEVEHPVNPGDYQVTLLVNDQTMGYVNGDGSFPQGTEVVISAIPAVGHHFLKWSDGSMDAERTITLTIDTMLTAYFEPNMYNVTFTNYDGRILQLTMESYGTMPKYVGKTPTRPTIDKYEYSFIDWSPSIHVVTDDVIYTALYDSTLVYVILTLDTLGADISNRWFAFAVPFEVHVKTGITKEGVNTPTLYGSSFVIDEYDGALRANTQNGWKRVAEADTLKPGKMYMFSSNSARVWRFSSESPAITYNKDDIAVQAYPSSIGDRHAGWNGIANSQLTSQNVSLEGVSYATIYDNTYGVYSTVLLNEWTCPHLTPFFVQTPTDGIVHFSVEDVPSLNYSPMRMLFSAENAITCIIEMTDLESIYTDKAYLTTNEEKEDQYIIGRDLAKLQVKNPSVPQVWLEAYDTRLAAYEVSTIKENVYVPIGLFAPQEGGYKLTINDIPHDLNIYLTQNGQNIGNLSQQASYTINLAEGDNNEYGLRIRKIQTAIYDVNSDNLNGECSKILLNNQILILRGEKVYTVTGQEIK